MSTEDEAILLMRRTKNLGEDVANFMQTQMGQFLLKKCEDRMWAALNELKHVDCTNSEAIRKLQNEIDVSESILQWFEEAIDEGLSAETVLEERLS